MTRTCFCSPGGGFVCTACLEGRYEDAMLVYVLRGCTGEHGVPLDEAHPALLRLQARGVITWEHGSNPSWKPVPAATPLHVYPAFTDGAPTEVHQLTAECWCRPRVELFDPETQKQHAAPLVVHRDQAQRDEEAS